MNTDEIIQKLQPWREKSQRAAWTPIVTAEDGAVTASKFAGTPWLAQGEAWPTCRICQAAMPMLLQLDLDTLPTAAAEQYGTGLLQLFYCLECSSWEPFSEAHLVRIVPPPMLAQPGTAPSDLSQELITTFPAKSIVEWRAFTDSPNPQEHEELGLTYTYNWDVEPNETRIDVPELGLTFEHIQDAAIAETIGEAAAGDKLGGWPKWVQDIEYPSCPTCQSRMGLLFQLDSEDNLPIMFGDLGTGHITQCPTHQEVVAFGWACS